MLFISISFLIFQSRLVALSSLAPALIPLTTLAHLKLIYLQTRLSVLATPIYIRGMHPAESQITSDSTSPLIDADGCSLRVEDIILSNPNGDTFGFAGDGVVTGLFLTG